MFPTGILKVKIFASTEELISCLLHTFYDLFFLPDTFNLSRHTFFSFGLQTSNVNETENSLIIIEIQKHQVISKTNLSALSTN